MTPQVFSYPILEEITQYYSGQTPVDSKNSYILACQHILEPQFEMFKLVLNSGIPKENILIFGKIYSTSNEILNEMKDFGLNVIQPEFDPNKSFDAEHKGNCENIFLDFVQKMTKPSKLIVLDDGGELLKVVNEKFDLVKHHVVIGVEQTSSGFRKLENTQLHFPVYNVARSVIKLSKESPLIANLGVGRIVEVITRYGIKEPRVLVVGLGPMGSNTLGILSAKGYFTLGYDIAHHSKKELINLIRDNQINIIVGVTGSNLLGEAQLEEIKKALKENIYLISMSSSDREFPTIFIRKNGKNPDKVHGDVVWDNLYLINNGFPITFKGKRYESTPQEIERTIALLYGSTMEALFNIPNESGFIDVPNVISNIINTV